MSFIQLRVSLIRTPLKRVLFAAVLLGCVVASAHSGSLRRVQARLGGADRIGIGNLADTARLFPRAGGLAHGVVGAK